MSQRDKKLGLHGMGLQARKGFLGPEEISWASKKGTSCRVCRWVSKIKKASKLYFMLRKYNINATTKNTSLALGNWRC